MKTRITEMVGIKYPIVLSGMSWISTPKMVAAVSNAGRARDAIISACCWGRGWRSKKTGRTCRDCATAASVAL